MSDLWEYDLGDEQLPDSDEDGSSRKRKAAHDAYTAESLLPADKLQRARRLYGPAFGGSPTDGFEGSTDDAEPAAPEYDSDVELIAQAGAQRASPGDSRPGGAEGAQAGAGTLLDARSQQLLAQLKGAMGHLKQQMQQGLADGAGDGDAEPSPDPSPVQLRSAAAAARGPEVAATPATAAARAASSAKGRKIVLKLETERGLGIQVRLRVTDKLRKAFVEFQNTAFAEGWLEPGGAEPKFMFDGDALQPSHTPAALGMEDEDKIEVYLRRT